MSSCGICLEQFTDNENENSVIAVAFDCNHKLCMSCLPNSIRNQEKLDSFEIKCYFPNCNGKLPIEKIRDLPKNEDYKQIIDELLTVIGNTNNIKNDKNEHSPTIDFQLALSDHCPNCKNLTVELQNVDACCVITCLGCNAKYCKACKYYMSHENYVLYQIMVQSPLEHESVIAQHIRAFHDKQTTFIQDDFIKPIQTNEKLFKIQELGKKHTDEQKQNVLLLHDIQELIKNANIKYGLEPETIKKIYLGEYDKKFSTMSQLNHIGLLGKEKIIEETLDIRMAWGLMFVGGIIGGQIQSAMDSTEMSVMALTASTAGISRMTMSAAGLTAMASTASTGLTAMASTASTGLSAMASTASTGLSAMASTASTAGISTMMMSVAGTGTGAIAGASIACLSIGLGLVFTIPVIASFFFKKKKIKNN